MQPELLAKESLEAAPAPSRIIKSRGALARSAFLTLLMGAASLRAEEEVAGASLQEGQEQVLMLGQEQVPWAGMAH